MVDTHGVTEEDDEVDFYARVGGRPFFVELVARFYAGVAEDPLLRPMYGDGLEPAAERLTAFLVQYFGGPREYEALRGEPRLRMRHLRFPLDEAARNAWLTHMGAALQASDAVPEDREAMWEYFVQAATFFMNRGGLTISGSS
jgi:hemoglobin